MQGRPAARGHSRMKASPPLVQLLRPSMPKGGGAPLTSNRFWQCSEVRATARPWSDLMCAARFDRAQQNDAHRVPRLCLQFWI